MEARIAQLKHLGLRIRREREQRGWNQDELATRAGIAVRTVSQAENGRSVQEANLRAIVELGLEQGPGGLERMLQLTSDNTQVTVDPVTDTEAVNLSDDAFLQLVRLLIPTLDAAEKQYGQQFRDALLAQTKRVALQRGNEMAERVARMLDG